jgi:tetratricopeptide (TPR) repeat protein
MAANQAESYFDHPMFQQAQKSLQKGEWEAGLSQLDSLMQAYPLDHELRAYRQEAALRARIDQEEKEDKADKRYRRFWNFSVRFAVVIGLLLLAFVVARLYSNWFGEQIAMARQEVEYQVRGVELAVKFRDAQDYMQAGRTEDALKLIGEVAAAEPDYPGLADLKANAEQKKGLEQSYTEAMGLYETGDLAGALAGFLAIQGENPNFKDSQVQVEKIKRELLLGDTLKEADAAFTARQWENAAEKYEQIYIISPDYETDYLESRLFESYINAAETLMASATKLEDYQTAEEYFRKALALRPQDPDVKAKQAEARKRVEDRLFLSYIDAAEALLAEGKNDLATYNQVKDYYQKAKALRPNDENIDIKLELADKFVQAQDHYVQGLYGQVIDGLEYVYSKDKGYAKGTARQTLYEAYVARGDSSSAVGDFNAALADFQRGAVLAEEDPGSKLRLYEIQLKLADVMGVLGDYEGAVRLYSSAVDLAGLRERAQSYSTVMSNALTGAESAASRGDYKKAWQNYREAVTYGLETFEVKEITVESDDYVSSLAVEYGSTVSLIAAANNLENPNIIVPGQKLLIPILP